MRVLVAMLAVVLGWSAAFAEEVRLVAFNVERGFGSGAEIPAVLSLMDKAGMADVWAIVEASPGDIDTFLKHLGKAYEGVEGRTDNGGDVLVILYDRRKFSRVDSDELYIPNLSFGQRQPLWVRLRSKKTGSEFYVVANHLHRGSEQKRLTEAQALNGWARTIDAPAIALGDFNLDFNIVGYPQSGPPQGSAYPVLLEDDVWAWVRPDVLMPTQCGSGYYSVLDFAFVADEAKQWPRESKIWDIGCKNTPQRPDHLPIDLVIDVP